MPERSGYCTSVGAEARGARMVTTSSVRHNPALAARSSGTATAILRVGWFAKGIVYVLAGVLAVAVWRSHTPAQEGEASPTGAVAQVRHATGGALLVGMLALGLFAYSLWRLLSAAMPGANDANAWLHRVGYIVSAVLYAVLGLGAARLAFESSNSRADGNQQVSDLSRRLMEHAAGRWAVGIVGAITIGVGIYRAAKGVRRDVDDELDLSTMTATQRTTLEWLAAVGEIGRGVGIGLVGVFLLRSSWNYDAQEATGLDGALRRMLTHWWGGPIVALVGVGFGAYGAFCLATFRHRRLERN
ncbi:MAG: DUF1206 domain-containing protein [Acidimicrobiia bacterium]